MSGLAHALVDEGLRLVRCNRAGVIEAARRLGYSRTSGTTRHYACPVEGRDREVADRLTQFRGTSSNPRGRKNTPNAALPAGA